LDLQVEVPFVPAAARRPKVLESHTDDTIVVVGQTRAKKRKRNSKKIAEQGETRESATAAGAEEKVASMSKAQGREEEPDAEMEMASDEQDDFDFSAVPNILDDDPESEAQERRTKQKRPKRQDRANRAKGLSFDLVHTHFNC
jgi:exosome complex exonuclease RRP6